MFVLDEDEVDEDIDEVSKAAGVNNSGNVLGDEDEVLDVEEPEDEDEDDDDDVVDELSDDSEVDDLEDLDDNVEATDEWSEADEYL